MFKTHCPSNYKKPSLSSLSLAIHASILSLSLLSNTTQAATINVTSNTDDGTACTLREAISSLNDRTLADGCISNGNFGNNDLITFSNQLTSPNNTIELTGSELYIKASRDISIDASSIPDGIIINSTNQSRPAEVLSVTNSTLSLNNITLTGGQSSSVRLLLGNSMRLFGGGLVAHSSTVTLNNSTVSGNFSNNGGGIYSDTSTIILNNSTISENSTSLNISATSNKTNGGGIFAQSSIVILNDSTISRNSVNGGNESSYNGTNRSGGGIFANNSAITLNNSTVLSNLTINGVGGGIYATNSSTATLNNSTISENAAVQSIDTPIYYAHGGGIFTDASTAIINNSIISNNSADNFGAGIVAERSSNITFNKSIISENSTTRGPGGGIASSSSSVTLIDSTVSLNSVPTRSGGLLSSRSTITLTNSTFSDNSSNLFSGGSTFIISNSIIANSLDGDRCEVTASSTFTIDSASIIEADSCGVEIGALRIDDPGLEPLADNGGPTQTHALSSNSIARNTGIFSGAFEPLQNCTTNDQTGKLRDSAGDNTCSVGAVEIIGSTSNNFNIIRLPNGKAVVFPL